MAHLIDKSALVAEIKRRKKYNHERAYLDRSSSMAGREEEDKDILSIIDTFEVKEEPVSEELEEAAIEYCGGNKGSDARVRTGFIMGAKWQKEQDKETIELAEDHAMLAGMEKMREQMMKDAVDGIVGYYNQRGLSISMNLPKDLEENDKVKLIIIKQHNLS